MKPTGNPPLLPAKRKGISPRVRPVRRTEPDSAEDSPNRHAEGISTALREARRKRAELMKMSPADRRKFLLASIHIDAEAFDAMIIDRHVPDSTYHPCDEFSSEPVLKERMGKKRGGSF